MKQLLISIIASLALYGFVAVAEEVPETPQTPATPQGLVKLPAMVDCGSSELIDKIVKEEYNETALAVYQGLIQLPNGQTMILPHVIYVNMDSRTTSIIAYFVDGSEMACMMTMGTGFSPAYSEVEPKTAL
jgi:hypothetical protein